MEFEVVKKDVEKQTCTKKVPHLRVNLLEDESEESDLEL